MKNFLLLIVLSTSLLSGCAKLDQSILVKEGDDILDCGELANELEFAKNLGENAPPRRRYIRALQEKKQCVPKPKISILIGVSGSL